MQDFLRTYRDSDICIDFHIFFPYYESYRQLFGYQLSSKYLYLYSVEEKNSYSWNKLRLSKWWQLKCVGELSFKFVKGLIKTLRPTETLHRKHLKMGQGAHTYFFHNVTILFVWLFWHNWTCPIKTTMHMAALLIKIITVFCRTSCHNDIFF